MNKELYVSSTPHETRLALAEDGEVAEVYYEREQEYSLAGSIYKGRVTRVLPGMQSAFVDIGLERDAFLYVSDFFEDSEEYDRVVSEAENAVARLERPAPVAAAPAASGEAPAEGEATQVAPAVEAVEREPPPPPIIVPAQTGRPGGDDDDRRRRGGRHRRGGRGQRGGFPESKFTRPDGGGGAPAERAPERPATAAEPPTATPATPAPYPAFVLPGESLAKYRQPAATQAAPPSFRRAEPASEASARPSIEPARETAGERELALPDAADAAALETATEQDRGNFEHHRMQPDAPRHEAPTAAPESAEVVVESVVEVFAGEAGEQSAEEFDEFENAGDDEPSETDELLAEGGAESGNADAMGDEAADAASVGGPPEPARMQAPAQGGQGDQRGGGRHRRRRRGGRMQREERSAETAAAAPAAPAPRPAGSGPRTITELLRAGQEILVQISKEPIGKKGARITSHLALPGRFLVYMPTVSHIGVSRKIASDEERARLKRFILEQSKDLPGGFIVRTAAAEASDEELASDVRLLANQWSDIRQQFESSRPASLLHHDLNLVERTLRDQLSNEFTHIWVDTDEMYQRVVKFVNYFMPQLSSRVRLHTREQPLFEHFGVQEEIDKALKSKVWLKSGGYIVLNQTEALVAIDVNTGKYVGRSNRLEDTIVKTNVDAIKEIVRQIRLRDLGGIIVIDFIDMDERRNRQRVMQALDEAMRADRAPSKVLAFNDFGLVALTRKRVKQSLERTLGSACPYCEGVGLVKSPVTVCNEIYLEARKVGPTIERGDLVLRVNPEIARLLKGNGAARLRELEELTGKPVSVRSDPTVHQQQFEIY